MGGAKGVGGVGGVEGVEGRALLSESSGIKGMSDDNSEHSEGGGINHHS